MAKITILTRMYNPGEYVYRCVDSVLNQTFTDFKYVIVDNASSDGTKEILEEYARKDSRIQLLRNEENNISVLHCFQNFIDTDYFMMLDHDDWLEVNALEVLFDFVEKNELDIAYGRTNFKTADEELMVVRGHNQTVILDSKDLPLFFRDAYWQFRTTWGAVIKSSLISHIDVDTYKFRACSQYGGDTVMMLSMAFAAERLGFIEDVIHNYRVHASSSYMFCRDRFVADWVLFDFAKQLLEQKGGYIKANEFMLYNVYGNAIFDTLSVAIQSGQDFDTIITVMTEIVKHPHTKELFLNLDPRAEVVQQVKNLFGPTVFIIYSCKPDDCRRQFLLDCWLKLSYIRLKLAEQDYDVLKKSDILEKLCNESGLDIYTELFSDNKKYDERYANIKLALLLEHESDVRVLAERLIMLQEQIVDLYEKVPAYIAYLAAKNNLLAGFKQEDYITIPEVVLRVVSEDYANALNRCLDIIGNEEVSNITLPLEVALRLSAVLENAEIFVALKKLECSLLIEAKNYVEAEMVLENLEDMCPGDSEVVELKRKKEEICRQNM